MAQSESRTSKIRPHEIPVYREQFNLYDLNGDGRISVGELASMSKLLGYRLSSDDVQELMRINDLDANGYLTFEEFLVAMPASDYISQQEHRMAVIRRKFQQYDKDCSGHVSVAEANEVLRKELAFNEHQTREMVRKYDKNNDGQLSYEEFINFYKKVKGKADEIQKLFEEFDVDNSGSISVAEAKRMLQQLEMDDDEVEALVAMHDTNQDGELQYSEFVTFMMES